MGRANAIKRTITKPTTPIARFVATRASCPSDLALMVTVRVSPDAGGNLRCVQRQCKEVERTCTSVLSLGSIVRSLVVEDWAFPPSMRPRRLKTGHCPLVTCPPPPFRDGIVFGGTYGATVRISEHRHCHGDWHVHLHQAGGGDFCCRRYELAAGRHQHYRRKERSTQYRVGRAPLLRHRGQIRLLRRSHLGKLY